MLYLGLFSRRNQVWMYSVVGDNIKGITSGRDRQKSTPGDHLCRSSASTLSEPSTNQEPNVLPYANFTILHHNIHIIPLTDSTRTIQKLIKIWYQNIFISLEIELAFKHFTVITATIIETKFHV